MRRGLFLCLITVGISLLLIACAPSPAPAQPTAAPAAAEEGEEEAAAEEAPAPAAEKPTLQIIWFAWQPCQALTELVGDYPDATVEVRCVPIAQWHDQIFTDFAAQGGADIPILDSQYIGEAVVGGHVIELTEWMQANVDMESFVPAALSAYGEYPPGSARYYGVPFEADTQMLVYRKDLFEAAGFEPPQTWSELLEQAQTFQSGDLVPYGYTTFWCGSPGCYDMVQTAWNQLAWSFGGELWDPETYQIEGVLNSPENLEALTFAAELYKTGPEGAGNYTFDEVVEAVCTGQVAMAPIWFGFGAAFIDPQGCAQADNLAFGIVPGETEHVISLGGMGLHVSAYSQNQEAALALVAWLVSQDVQLRWAELGGFSARIDVLDSETFANAAPYNSAFAESYKLVKDFWNLPEYIELLEPQGEYLNLAITGQMDPQEALDTIAQRQQEIIDQAYPDGPPQ